jgi:hypothetical protein
MANEREVPSERRQEPNRRFLTPLVLGGWGKRNRGIRSRPVAIR